MTPTRLLRLLLAAAVVVLTIAVAAPSHADCVTLDGSSACGDEYPSDDDMAFDDASSGIPGFFVAFFVIALVGGIGTTIWKVTTARRLAEDAGMDPDMAGRMAFMTHDGLDATYLASQLRQRPALEDPPAPARPVPAVKDAATRLAELKTLLDGGHITQAEHDARRKAIIDGV